MAAGGGQGVDMSTPSHLRSPSWAVRSLSDLRFYRRQSPLSDTREWTVSSCPPPPGGWLDDADVGAA